LIQLPGLAVEPYRLRYQPILPWRDAGLREVGRLMAPRVLGLAAVQLNFLVTTVLAVGLTAGSLTALNYGWIIMLLPQGVIAQSVATALFPTLAALVARGERAEMRRVFIVTLRNLLFLTLPASVGLIILRQPIVAMLLERGAFDAASTRMTATALGFFSIGLVAHALVEFTARDFYALKNTKTPVGIGVFAMALNIVLSIWLMPFFAEWGWSPHGGLALANSLAVTVEMVILLVLLRRPLGGLDMPGLKASLLKMGGATLGMVIVLLLLVGFFSAAPVWLLGLGGIALGGATYLALAYLLRLDELQVVLAKVAQRIRPAM
jgi:putative peptidoglycan lipid II flippase